jgi:hypothetical protein
MAVTITPYGAFAMALLSGAGPDFTDEALVVKFALATSSYVPDRDTHAFFDDVTDQVTGAGYASGGVTLTGLAVTYEADLDAAVLSADAADWTGCSFTCRYGVLYVSTGVASTSPLIACVDFGEDKEMTAQDFHVAFPAAAAGGMLRVG